MEYHALSVSHHLQEAQLGTHVVVAVCRDVRHDGLQVSHVSTTGPAPVVLHRDRRLTRQGHGDGDGAGGPHGVGDPGGHRDGDVVCQGDVALQRGDPDLRLVVRSHQVRGDRAGAARHHEVLLVQGQAEDVGPVRPEAGREVGEANRQTNLATGAQVTVSRLIAEIDHTLGLPLLEHVELAASVGQSVLLQPPGEMELAGDGVVPRLKEVKLLGGEEVGEVVLGGVLGVVLVGVVVVPGRVRGGGVTLRAGRQLVEGSVGEGGGSGADRRVEAEGGETGGVKEGVEVGDTAVTGDQIA